MNIEYIGYTAGVFAVSIFLPQTIKILKTKSAKDLSLMTLIITVINCSLWVLYGILKEAPSVYVTNSLMEVVALVTLYLKVKYSKN